MAVLLHGTMGTPDYRDWYNKARWAKRSRAQRRAYPLCEMCLLDQRICRADVADHVIPHRGDEKLFWEGELQSLCKICHDKSKRFQELRGYKPDIGIDGWPLDKNHPANRK